MNDKQGEQVTMKGKESMKKSYMRYQGNGYIVAHYDATVDCWRESGEMPYHQARASVGTANCRDPHCRKESHNHHNGDVLISGKVYEHGVAA